MDKRLDQCFEEGKDRMEPFRLSVSRKAMKTVALGFIERRLVGLNGNQDAGGYDKKPTRKHFHLQSHLLLSPFRHLGSVEGALSGSS